MQKVLSAYHIHFNIISQICILCKLKFCRLWGNIVKGRGNTVAAGEETNTEENEINPSADYEAEHLWGEIDSSRLKPDDYYTKNDYR